MKQILLAVALVVGTLALAGSATAAITGPKAHPDKNALIAITRANPPHSPRLSEVTRGSHGPRVVVKGARQVAGPVPSNVAATSTATGYQDQAAAGVQFTFIKTYFNVPSVSSSSGCNGNPADGSVLQIVGIDGTGTPDSEAAALDAFAEFRGL
jgi:hypothetical protein